MSRIFSVGIVAIWFLLTTVSVVAEESKTVVEYRVVFLTAEWCGPCNRAKAEFVPWLTPAGWKINNTEQAHIQLVDYDKQRKVFEKWQQCFNDDKEQPIRIPMLVLVAKRSDKTEAYVTHALYRNKESVIQIFNFR